MTDYIVIGSIGYAQLGQDDYYQKEQVEKKFLLIWEKKMNYSMFLKIFMVSVI